MWRFRFHWDSAALKTLALFVKIYKKELYNCTGGQCSLINSKFEWSTHNEANYFTQKILEWKIFQKGLKYLRYSLSPLCLTFLKINFFMKHIRMYYNKLIITGKKSSFLNITRLQDSQTTNLLHESRGKHGVLSNMRCCYL